MAYKITSVCTSCGRCVPVCPVGAISEGESYYVIDPELCVDCVGYSEDPLCLLICSVEGAIEKIE